ncbi:hypothetical protein BC940DRAFT_3071 [Gongronella butleri]|nr:hypothetical protein BC940DRAFT_3071 [Gongronella butleri]
MIRLPSAPNDPPSRHFCIAPIFALNFVSLCIVQLPIFAQFAIYPPRLPRFCRLFALFFFFATMLAAMGFFFFFFFNCTLGRKIKKDV